MGIYSASNDKMDQELKNPNALLESMIFDELCHLSDDKKTEFINSNEATVMIEAGLINRKTLVRLSKSDDLSRRTKMAAFQLAKENDDMLWTQLVKNRMKERELISKIVNKYGSKAERSAKIGQKDFLTKKIPLAFMRPGGVK